MKKEDVERGDGENWVLMYHPDLEDSYSLQTKDAFEEVYKDKGFVLDTQADVTSVKTNESQVKNPPEGPKGGDQ